MTIDGGKVVVRLEGRDVNLSQLITKIERDMKGASTVINQFDGNMAKLGATTKRTESETLAYAQAMARADIAAGRYSQGIQRLAAAITQIALIALYGGTDRIEAVVSSINHPGGRYTNH